MAMDRQDTSAADPGHAARSGRKAGRTDGNGTSGEAGRSGRSGRAAELKDRMRNLGGSMRDRMRAPSGDGLATALGWFSIGLGAAQLLAPEKVARLVGASAEAKDVNVMRAVGARELMAGIGILATDRRAEWLWARVAGDTMDLAILGRLLSQEETERGRAIGASVAVAGVMALDAWAARQLGGDMEAATA